MFVSGGRFRWQMLCLPGNTEPRTERAVFVLREVFDSKPTANSPTRWAKIGANRPSVAIGPANRSTRRRKRYG